MTRQSVRFDVTLTLIAPILTKTSGAIGLGLDAAMLRDPQGRPAFYQSHIKGKLREAWETLRKTTGAPDRDFISYWLGKVSPVSSDDAPLRGELSFDAYWVDPTWKVHTASSRRYRVRVDPDSGAVDAGALQVIESLWPSGAPIQFTGGIYARASEQERADLLRYFRLGFNLIPALGALKGNGFGRLASAAVVRQIVASARQTLDARLAAADRVGLRIHPCDPFCFAQLATGSQNAYVADEYIPGGALIAALHRRVAADPGRFTLLAAALDKLAVSHARPVLRGKGTRAVAVPLSLVHTPRGFRDIGTRCEAGTIDGQVPAFCIDWKDHDWAAAMALLNPDCRDPHQPNESLPHKCLLIRTAIDDESQTSAENQLFSTETVVPDGCDWLANLDLSAVAEPAKVLKELADLLAEPLTHLGKTKARASVRIEPSYPFSVPSQPLTGPLVAIHLQSSAALLPDNFTAPATNGGAALADGYRRAWDEISGGTLTLSHFFASQQLFGGAYWWNRYRKPDPAGGGAYRPRVLTTAGSVFLLRVVDLDGAKTCIARWQRRGLPQLAGTPGGECWQHNPWIGTNGYGEIAVNLDLDAALRRLPQ